MKSNVGDDPKAESKWATFKDRLGIALMILMLLVLVFFLIDGAVMNFQCSFTEFVTWKCNRWDAGFKKWQ